MTFEDDKNKVRAALRAGQKIGDEEKSDLEGIKKKRKKSDRIAVIQGILTRSNEVQKGSRGAENNLDQMLTDHKAVTQERDDALNEVSRVEGERNTFETQYDQANADLTTRTGERNAAREETETAYDQIEHDQEIREDLSTEIQRLTGQRDRAMVRKFWPYVTTGILALTTLLLSTCGGSSTVEPKPAIERPTERPIERSDAADYYIDAKVGETWYALKDVPLDKKPTEYRYVGKNLDVIVGIDKDAFRNFKHILKKSRENDADKTDSVLASRANYNSEEYDALVLRMSRLGETGDSQRFDVTDAEVGVKEVNKGSGYKKLTE